MKSCATQIQALMQNIFRDVTAWYPDLCGSVELDLSYFHSASEHRGVSFFTLTLPDFGHWIDRSLDEGAFFDCSEIPRGIPLHQGKPELFRGILMKVFTPQGLLRDDAEERAVFFLRTLTQSLKKLELEPTPVSVRKAVESFIEIEQQLPRSHPNTWDANVPVWEERSGHPLWGMEKSRREPDLFGERVDCVEHSPPWDTLAQLARRVVSDIGVPNIWQLRPRHGPGAVVEGRKLSKYEFPNWPSKLEGMFPFDWFGHGDMSSPYQPADRELHANLAAVPKTVKGPRLICSEPISHQWIQQGIWRWLRDRIEGVQQDTTCVLQQSISFSSQQNSQKLVLSASKSRSHATLDLSSASDRLSTRLVEYLFQGSELLDMMHACRTRSFKQTLHPNLDKVWIARKFATSGSALTFPIQSIVFSILSVWALRLYEGRENDWTNWRADFGRVRVFGDDIIVPTHAYRLTRFVLHECGLLVNDRKSFGGISFRESCGCDAFRGVDVTPPRYKELYNGSPTSTASLVEYSNNLYKKGMWHASNEVLNWLPESERKLLLVSGCTTDDPWKPTNTWWNPVWENAAGHSRIRPTGVDPWPRSPHTKRRPVGDGGSLGLFTFGQSDLHLRRKRWDTDYQREYVLRLAFTTKVKIEDCSGAAHLSQYFTEDPSSSLAYLADWHSGKVSVERTRKARSRVYL